MKKILNWLDNNLEVVLCVILMSVMTVIIFIQVVARYVFHNSLTWSEELARYIFIWLIFLGISYGSHLRKHIKIDAALSLFPKKVRPYIQIVGDILFLILAVYLVYTGFNYSVYQAEMGKRSSAMGIPYQFVYSSVWVGFGLTAIRQVQAIVYRVKCIKNGEEAD